MSITEKMKDGNHFALISHRNREDCECKPEVILNPVRRAGRQGYRFDKEIIHNPLPVATP